MGPLSVDAIFSGMSRDSDKNRATLAKKGREMDRSAVTNKIVTPTAASDSLANISIKVSVSTLCRDSQKPEDTPLPTCGPPPLLSEEE